MNKNINTNTTPAVTLDDLRAFVDDMNRCPIDPPKPVNFGFISPMPAANGVFAEPIFPAMNNAFNNVTPFPAFNNFADSFMPAQNNVASDDDSFDDEYLFDDEEIFDDDDICDENGFDDEYLFDDEDLYDDDELYENDVQDGEIVSNDEFQFDDEYLFDDDDLYDDDELYENDVQDGEIVSNDIIEEELIDDDGFFDNEDIFGGFGYYAPVPDTNILVMDVATRAVFSTTFLNLSLENYARLYEGELRIIATDNWHALEHHMSNFIVKG